MAFGDEKIRRNIVRLLSNGLDRFSVSDWQFMINASLDSKYFITEQEKEQLAIIVDAYTSWWAKSYVLKSYSDAYKRMDSDTLYKTSMYDFLSREFSEYVPKRERYEYVGMENAQIGNYYGECEKYNLTPLGLVEKKVLLGTCDVAYNGMYKNIFERDVSLGISYELKPLR